MSVTFHGRRPDGHVVALDFEDWTYLNMSNCNARAFLLFLRLDPGEHLDGEMTMPEVRRAIMFGRATFERRVGSYTREDSDAKRPGQSRVIVGGIDAGYFARRLGDFERFVNAVAEQGATSIWWG